MIGPVALVTAMIDRLDGVEASPLDVQVTLTPDEAVRLLGELAAVAAVLTLDLAAERGTEPLAELQALALRVAEAEVGA